MMKILLVEDDYFIRSMMVEALTDEGFQVLEAETGEQALAHCDDGIADVLVTDIRLPGSIDGWDIAEHCRKSNPDLPVIYATGYSHVAARPVSGSVSFQKPYPPDRLIDVIRSLMGAAER
jgi:DNA-binding NtrC family response regulator